MRQEGRYPYVYGKDMGTKADKSHGRLGAE
jgi:hypothetical protein